ncbi:Transmembrane protein 43-like protein [Armadillidium vulgare]|nr:Transmembrane protein 43-like protein [Armadillidium vulgare]
MDNHQHYNHTSRHRTSATNIQHHTDVRPGPFSRERRNLIYKSLRERVRDSLPAVIIGSILIICGAALLFWNEGEAVNTARTLDEGYNSVIHVTTADFVDPNNDEKLVHVWGSLSVVTPLQDSFYGIKVKAVSLKRRVQTYQWVEEESSYSSSENNFDSPSDSSYSYSQKWKDKLVDSSSFYIPFGHENPNVHYRTSIVPAVIQTAEIVKIGSYNLSPAIKETFTKFIAFSGDEQPDTDEVKLHNGMYYFTKDIFNPETGDIRVQFYFADNSDRKKQSSDSLHPYVTSSGRELLMVREGKISIEEMFSSEHAQNRILTWFYRLFGWFLLFIGMTSVSSIVQYLVAQSPLLRDVIFLGLGSANLTLSMSLSLLLIGGAWTFYRPTLALMILVCAAFPILRASLKTGRRAERSFQNRNVNGTTDSGGV